MTSGGDDETRARIAAVVDMLGAMLDGPHTRELRAKAETYRAAVEQWATTNVSTAQRLALRELVEELHARTEAARRGALESRPPLSTPTASKAPQLDSKKRI
jgi:hypothetical protein